MVLKVSGSRNRPHLAAFRDWQEVGTCHDHTDIRRASGRGKTLTGETWFVTSTAGADLRRLA